MPYCSLMQSVFSRYVPHRQTLLPKAVPRAGITLCPATAVMRTGIGLSLSLCPLPASMTTQRQSGTGGPSYMQHICE